VYIDEQETRSGACLVPRLLSGRNRGGSGPGTTLTGDWGDRRNALANRGLSVGGEYTNSYQGDVSGPEENGMEFAHRFDLFLGVDSGKLELWNAGGVKPRSSIATAGPSNHESSACLCRMPFITVTVATLSCMRSIILVVSRPQYH
jgi:hypothetical protein